MKRHARSLKGAAALLALLILTYVGLRPLCVTARETLVLLMVPAFGGCLLLFWPRSRRVRIRAVAFYVVVMLGIIAVAVAAVAHVAGGRVIATEVLLVTYFAFGWRLAWEVWARTVGRAGHKYVRLLRRRWSCRKAVPLGARRAAANILGRSGIHGLRIFATALLFVPAFFSTVCTLRLKIGNSFDPDTYAGMPYEDAVFTTTDGLTIRGWYLPTDGSKSTVMICHGLGANKGNFFEFVRLFYNEGYNVLIFDFRGHGDSDGHTSGMGLLEDRDVLAAAAWLESAHPEGAEHIYGLGSSMGAAALVRAARQTDRIEALVLDSCYASAELLAEQHTRRFPLIGPAFAWVTQVLLSVQLGQAITELDPVDAIGDLGGTPVLLIHAADDVIIPSENLDILYEAASAPKQRWLGPGSHSNVLTEDFHGYQRRVLEFLSAYAG